MTYLHLETLSMPKKLQEFVFDLIDYNIWQINCTPQGTVNGTFMPPLFIFFKQANNSGTQCLVLQP